MSTSQHCLQATFHDTQPIRPYFACAVTITRLVLDKNHFHKKLGKYFKNLCTLCLAHTADAEESHQ